MQDFNSLDSLYREYRGGSLDQRELEGKMFSVILKNARDYRWFEGNEDEIVDYLCWIYPRISKAVRHFKDNGAAFSTYIGALIRYSMREYKSAQLDHYITEYAAWTTQAMDMEVHSPEIDYPEAGFAETNYLEPEETGNKFLQAALQTQLKSRQILLLILKSYYYLSEDFIDRIAPHTGVDAETLKQMVEKLRFSRNRKEEQFHRLQERIANQFYRCIAWEKRLKILTPESTRYQVIQIQLERARKRLAGMRQRFARLRLDATHRQIAEVTGISTGTVSSSLSTIRSRWELDNKGQPVPREEGGKKSGRKSLVVRGKGENTGPGNGREKGN
ncbi:MAG: hypothetical protein LBK83_09450 [Treponema sp.]|jgi:hypothetical protein|nr:hypothetical protein [Treponema sp.]